MIIPIPPVSLTLSAASEFLNSPSYAVPRRLYCQNHNAVAIPPLSQPKLHLPKSDTIDAAVL